MLGWSLAAGAAGLAFLLFGLGALGRSLAGLSGRYASGLAGAARHPWRGFLFGAGATVALQSSSAVTALLTGFVQGGLLTPAGALPVLLGSNIGTTLTPWLLVLGGQAPAAVLPLLCIALAGAGLVLLAGKHRPGQALLCAAILLAGLELLARAATPLAALPAFAPVLALLQNPLAGFGACTAFTALVQSSAAVVGLLQGFCRPLTLGMVLPAVAGANLGTCSTALLAALGQGPQARKVALAHLRFNLLGSAAALALLALLWLFGSPLPACPAPFWAPAALHTGFNLAAVALVWPARNLLLLGKKRTTPF